MSNKHRESEAPAEGFTNEATRRRWELFHRAIAYAKQSNVHALEEQDGVKDDACRTTLKSVAG